MLFILEGTIFHTLQRLRKILDRFLATIVEELGVCYRVQNCAIEDDTKVLEIVALSLKTGLHRHLR